MKTYNKQKKECEDGFGKRKKFREEYRIRKETLENFYNLESEILSDGSMKIKNKLVHK